VALAVGLGAVSGGFREAGAVLAPKVKRWRRCLNDFVSLESERLAAVACSTMAAFFWVSWSICSTALLISAKPADREVALFANVSMGALRSAT
jgi:hypothetical protein